MRCVFVIYTWVDLNCSITLLDDVSLSLFIPDTDFIFGLSRDRYQINCSLLSAYCPLLWVLHMAGEQGFAGEIRKPRGKHSSSVN